MLAGWEKDVSGGGDATKTDGGKPEKCSTEGESPTRQAKESTRAMEREKANLLTPQPDRIALYRVDT